MKCKWKDCETREDIKPQMVGDNGQIWTFYA